MTKDSFSVYELDFSSFVLLPRATNGKPEMRREELKGKHWRSSTEGNIQGNARPSLTRSQSGLLQSDLKATAKEFVPSTPTHVRSRAHSTEDKFQRNGRVPPLLRSQSFGGFDAFARNKVDETPGKYDWSSSPLPANISAGPAATIPAPDQHFNFKVPVPEEGGNAEEEEVAPAVCDKETQRRMWDEEMCAAALRESFAFEEGLVDCEDVDEDEEKPSSTCDFSKLSLNLSPEMLCPENVKQAPSTAPHRERRLSPSHGQKEAEARRHSQSMTAKQQQQQQQQMQPAAQFNAKHRKSLSLYTISETAAAADKLETPSTTNRFPKAPPPTPQVTPSSQAMPPLSPALTAALLANPSLLLPMQPGLMSPLQLASLQMATMAFNFPMTPMSPMSPAAPRAPMPSPAMIQTLQNHARTKSFDQWKADLANLMGGPITPTVQKSIMTPQQACGMPSSIQVL